MCACRQKKSFLIEDILQDVKKKPYKTLSQVPTKPLTCNGVHPVEELKIIETKILETNTEKPDTQVNVVIQNRDTKITLDHRRNTYPIYPMPIKPNTPWPYTRKESGYLERPPFSYYSTPILNSSQLLRTQLAANRFITHPYAVRQAYGFERGTWQSSLILNLLFIAYFSEYRRYI